MNDLQGHTVKRLVRLNPSNKKTEEVYSFIEDGLLLVYNRLLTPCFFPQHNGPAGAQFVKTVICCHPPIKRP